MMENSVSDNSEVFNPDTDPADRAQMPLLGVILCCTSIPPEKRVELADVAAQMGAIHKFDLTSDVTHMIVGDTDTPKYKFVARERADVKCLLPSWVDAVRQSWVAGGETDVERLEAEHKLPTFQGLRICVTGFEDLAYRKELEDLIKRNGGKYRGNLTKDVTHLIAKEPSGTKYTYAGDWGINTVSIEWLTQSLERGMILEEKLYNLLLPASERGQNAWIRRTVSTSSLGKRVRAEEAPPKRSRKLRRTASAKLSSQNIGLWTDIVSGGTEAGDTKLGEWDDQQTAERPDLVNVKTKVSGRHSSEKEITKESPKSKFPDPNALGSNSSFSQSRIGQRGGLFKGHKFFVHGFTERQSSILQSHLRSHLGEIVNDIVELSKSSTTTSPEAVYLLVPYNTAYHDIPMIPQGTIPPPVVTDMWVERCLHCQTLVQPQANVTNTPFCCFPIAGFEKLSISSTAFQGVDLLHVSKAVKLMGATYEEFFTPNVSVLVCNAKVPSAEKFNHALRWKVPIVTAEWIWDCIGAGVLKSFDKYLIQTSSHETPTDNSAPFFSGNGRESKCNREALSRTINTADARPKGQASERTNEDFSTPPADKSMVDNDINLTFSSRISLLDEQTQNDREVPKDGESQEHEQIPKVEQYHNPKHPNRNHDCTSNLCSGTLKEISVSSSPKRPPSPVKSPTSSQPKSHTLYKEEDSLGPAISDLLARHQRSSAGSIARPISEVQALGRRRKQLLGRAPSNGSIGFSRASSIDTLNTDGLGTPLETSTARNEPDPLAALRSYGDRDSSHETSDQHLQLTQLGYEDPDVQVWRDRIVKKMGGVTENEAGDTEGAGKRVKSIGVVKDVIKRGTEGVAKRTRQAMGRR